MPIPGYNAQTYRDYWRFLLEGIYGATPSDRWNDTVFFQCIQEAERVFQESLGLVQVVDTSTIALTASQLRHTLPTNIQGQRINDIWIMESSATSYGPPLPRVPYSEAISPFAVFDSDATDAEPVAWTLDINDPTQIIFLPTPDTSGTVIISYRKRLDPLRRILNLASITATVTNNSTTVTLSATPTLGAVASGDDFGIEISTQSDGSASTSTNPPAWYRTTNVSGTAVTLAENYEGPNASGAAFIMAQVSDIERAYPSKFGNAMAIYAAGVAAEGDPKVPGRAKELKNEALSILYSTSLDDDRTDVLVWDVYNQTPFYPR